MPKPNHFGPEPRKKEKIFLGTKWRFSGFFCGGPNFFEIIFEIPLDFSEV